MANIQWRSLEIMKFLVVMLLTFSSLCGMGQTMITYDTIVTGASGSAWNMTITRRDDLFTRPLTDSVVAFYFFPGVGETGSNVANLKLYGPHWWRISGGWDGGVQLVNGRHFPTLISIQPLTAWSSTVLLLPKLTAITNKMRVKANCRFATGYSMGGWTSFLLASYKTSPSDLAWVKFFKVIVNVRGAKPADNGTNHVGASGYPYPQRIGHYTANGGKIVNLDQIGDGGRDMATITTAGNDSSAGSVIYVKTQFGTSNGHTDSVNASFNPNIGWTTAQNQGVYQQTVGTLDTDWYTYCYRQGGDSTFLSGGGGGEYSLPQANAGTDQTKYMPDNSVTLTGVASTGSGALGYSWSKISGPTEGNFSSTTDVSPTISNLAVGTYQFRLVVTDTASATSSDTVVVNSYGQKSPNCSVGSPVKYTLTASGSQIYYTNLTASFPSLKGGDTLAIPTGTYTLVQLQNFTGDSCRPIVIINSGGQVQVTGQFRVYDGRFFKLTGTGHSGTTYGFYGRDHNSSGLVITLQSSDGIVENFQFSRVVNGVFAKMQVTTTDALTYVPNWEYKDMEFRNILSDSTTGEAFYIGHTLSPDICSSDGKVPVNFTGYLRIHDNIVTNCGWDGIQVSLSRDSTLIYNNDVSEYGNRNRSSQQSGIILGGYSRGRIWNNLIYRGTGTGIAVFGQSLVKVHDNILDSAGTWPAWPTEGPHVPQPSMYFNGNVASCTSAPDSLQMDVFNNCIAHPSSYASGAGIRHANTSGMGKAGTITTNTLYDPTLSRSLGTLIVTAASDNTTGNSLGTCGVLNPNLPPVANAGIDQEITLPINSVTLAGSGDDVDGTITSNVWSKTSGPATFTITDANNYGTTVTNLVEGTYVFKLTVTDDDAATHEDEITIVVNPEANQAPAANAGSDTLVEIPSTQSTTSTQLNGSGTDIDGTISTYAWVQTSGGFATISNAAIQNPTISDLTEGVYTFQLTVTDNDGATDIDVVVITVIHKVFPFKLRKKFRFKEE